EQLNDFVQALFENDFHLDMYTEHQGYDVLEMINDDRHCEDKSDNDFKDVKKGDNLDDVKDIVDFQTEDKEKGKFGEGSSHKDLGKGSAGGSSDKGKRKLGKDRSEPSKTHLCQLQEKMKWLQFKRLFWKAAVSSMNEQFLEVKAYFEVDRSCAAFENGISESFNLKILFARGKPIITMLEDIRVYIMQRVWFLNKTAMELNDSITPFARRYLEFMKIRQRKWVELTGLPCVHAVARYIHLKKDPELGVTEWFLKNKWFESYKYSIRLVLGTKLWKKSNLPKPLPPGERKLPGRPRKRRIRHPSEYDHEISRVGRVMHCHRCWQSGHNKSKCTNAPKPKPDNLYEIPTDKERKHGSNNEHAEIMDKEAFADLVRKDAENKAKEDEMWRNTEPVNPAEQTHVIASASSAPVDEQPETSQDPSTENAGSSADPKKKANKRKKKADSKQPLPFRIYHKNIGRSERIANLQAKKFKFDANGTRTTPEKAFDVSD
nr:hypothetical protein [Tanacetum cinerariifolium]